MMRMIDPLSELCGPCVELLGTSWSMSQQGHKEPNVWKPHVATWGGWEVSKGLHATCVYSPTSLPCQPPEEQDIFFSLTLIGVFCLEGVHISSLKEIEKQMKQYNHPQSFKVTEHSKQ